MTESRYAVILAAGKGTRMQSDLPKVLMELAGKPMLFHVLDNIFPLQLESIFIVVGYKKELVMDSVLSYVRNSYPVYEEKVVFVEQKEQLGTAHAFMMAEPFLSTRKGYVLVTAGDMPLLSKDTFEKMFGMCISHQASGLVLGARLENPAGYGRFVRDREGNLLRIVEEKDADEEIKKIKEVNTGCYVFRVPEIFAELKEIKNKNSQKEYYLPDVIEISRLKNKKFLDFMLDDHREALGANTREELNLLNSIFTGKK